VTILEGATMLIAGAAFIGAIYSIWRNGRRQSDKFTEVKTELKTNLENVTKELQDENYGLRALGQKVNDFKVHCATVSTRLSTKLEEQGKDIEGLGEKVRKIKR